MASNLPPGVTEGMIPGNRPEDAEVDCPIVFCVGDVELIVDFIDRYRDGFYSKLPRELREMFGILEGIYDQLLEDERGKKVIDGYREYLRREQEMVDSAWECPFGKSECDQCDDMCEDRRR